ncbi:MAG: Na(+)-translocating NADH-quinone reductase subunit C [Moraxellaceae bacterium]|nr:Na(+)-translocating NADH-quinone reductase subunit C [Pseudomonadales bacterium]MCB1674000.1 Na(+)-translocating NADH-quinone reductase subunit C [Pseudomonadales bacterium]MCP5173715.1 Na(+)-translocating NADH-quinone reductase subunit C [Moraxellaceae bacterium]HQV21949.1 Na(+)-translocating NADH-quinone reductase subunit C [Agitococcus sp.]
MSKESTGKTIVVAGVLSIVCSMALAAAVTLLKPIQSENKELDKQRKILAAAAVMADGQGTKAEVNQAFSKFERYLVDLNTGEFKQITLDDKFDQRKDTKTPSKSMALDVSQDIAGLKRRANQADIYVLRDATGKVEKMILPISGYGLWSTLYGYLVVNQDANTIGGITFVEHAETPGLGGEVDNPKWKALWVNKQAYDSSGDVQLKLVKGGVDPSKPDAIHHVDALSGATLTSNGVSNLVQFWMGDMGFKKFLAHVKEKGI